MDAIYWRVALKDVSVMGRTVFSALSQKTEMAQFGIEHRPKIEYRQ
jgi:hypothetical protein